MRSAGSESLDAVLRGALRLHQPAKGYRANADPLLLAAFVASRPPTRRRPVRTICDLGAGTGILGLALALATPAASVTLVELDVPLAEMACRNAALNRLEERTEVVQSDLRAFASARPARYDLVLANPPYRAFRRGPLSVGQHTAGSRHELTARLDEVVDAAARLACPQGGRIAIVFTAARAAELFAFMVAAGAPPQRVRVVHPYASDPALLVLALGERDYRGSLEIEPPLVLHESGGAPTAEARTILDGTWITAADGPR